MAKFTPAITLIVCLASVGAASAQEATKPLGRWERKVGKHQLTLILDENRLHIYSTGEKPGALHADYAMTRDGVIYGVVTSIEYDEVEEADVVRKLFDAPFSFRFRIDEGAMVIHDSKLHEMENNVWDGRFKPVRPVMTRAAAFPTYYTVPASWLNNPPPSNNPINLPFDTPAKSQVYHFWTGYVR